MIRLFVLQWARATNGAETPEPSRGILTVEQLQWGRATNGAETWRSRAIR